jgi:hypothetical protein
MEDDYGVVKNWHGHAEYLKAADPALADAMDQLHETQGALEVWAAAFSPDASADAILAAAVSLTASRLKMS